MKEDKKYEKKYANGLIDTIKYYAKQMCAFMLAIILLLQSADSMKAATVAYYDKCFAVNLNHVIESEENTEVSEENMEVPKDNAADQQIQLSVSAPSVLLMESSTGQIIYEHNSEEARKPASITKIMTLLLTFEALEKGKIKLDDKVVTSAYAKSMGGSQVFLEEGEIQTVDTLIKCIAVASGNDAAVAMAEHIAGSEDAFVEMMNEEAKRLHMDQTNFEDCCGLTDSDSHVTSAKDVAIMSRELITRYPQIYDYTKIWMEDITHETAKGTSQFTLSSTNKLLKQYEYATGLKTGSTSSAKYCLSATANKDGIDLIAVVMAAPDHKVRFQDAVTLLNYGFSVCQVYKDENKDKLAPVKIEGGVLEKVPVSYKCHFSYMDTTGADFSKIEKTLQYHEPLQAPVKKGDIAGYAVYQLGGSKIGEVEILFDMDVKKAYFADYVKKVAKRLLL